MTPARAMLVAALLAAATQGAAAAHVGLRPVEPQVTG